MARTASSAKIDFSETVAIFNRAFRGVQYIEQDGYTIRVWEDVDCCNAEHVVEWLRGKKVVEDLRDGLEFIKQATLDRLVRDRHLVKLEGGMYGITDKAAKHYGLDAFVKGRQKGRWVKA